MVNYDARIVNLYDSDNPADRDHAYYRSFVDECGARSVVDLGCGTGILTVTLTAPDRSVVGIDPSATMLDYARARPDGDLVEWIHGDSSAIRPESADAAIMSGNVAQHITGDAWPTALHHLALGLRPGGRLAFESRNPADRAWEVWPAYPRTTRDTADGPLTEWMEVESTEVPGEVDLVAHNIFESSGEHLVIRERLAFRGEAELREALTAAGLIVDRVSSGWSRTPFTGAGRIMVFEASKPHR